MPSRRTVASRRAAAREASVAAREDQREPGSRRSRGFSKLRKQIHSFLYLLVLSGSLWCPLPRWFNAMCEVHILPFMLESMLLPLSFCQYLPPPIGVWFMPFPEDMNQYALEGKFIQSWKNVVRFDLLWGGPSLGLKVAVFLLRWAWFSWRASAWDGTYVIVPELLILMTDVVMHGIRVYELCHRTGPYYVSKLPWKQMASTAAPAPSIVGSSEGPSAVVDECRKEFDENQTPISLTSSHSEDVGDSPSLASSGSSSGASFSECICCLDQVATWKMSDCGHTVACKDCSCALVQRALGSARKAHSEQPTPSEIRTTRFPCPLCRTSGTIERESSHEKMNCACCMNKVASWRMSGCEHLVACGACRHNLVYHVLRKHRVAGVTSKRALTNELLHTTVVPCPLCREAGALLPMQPLRKS